MGRVRAAGFRQRNLREAAGQPRRPAQGDRDFVLQGSGCRLGETGDPDRAQGRWQGSIWPVGYSSQHYGKTIGRVRPSPNYGVPMKSGYLAAALLSLAPCALALDGQITIHDPSTVTESG